jgi:hypothetical protein
MATRHTYPGSAVVYRGRSTFDDQPIVAVVTGLRRSSNNPKTGPMAQLWILRADVNPNRAIETRADYSVCGDCPLRGDRHGRSRACYVTVSHSPGWIYRAFRAGRYRELEPAAVARILESTGRSIRLGAYGDVTAMPVWVVDELVGSGKTGIRWTGYTHQWRDHVAQLFKPYLMASVDTLGQSQRAQAAGWRTFRTRVAELPLFPAGLAAGEIACPAAAESGHSTTCDRCGLCNGVRRSGDQRRSIAIVAHGNSAVHFAKWVSKQEMERTQ